MDFIDELRQFSTRVGKIKDRITTEEATKNSLILPFFQLLGYDIFNPDEFIPEFTADVGTKKGEKVDYAIIIDNEPVILIEAKWCGEALDKHDSQLFRYFGTSTAKFGILTNGIIYKFYTDLNEANKMDLEPFLVINILDLRENLVSELKRFAKSTLDIEAAFNAASELKYTNLIKLHLQIQRANPTDEFVRYMMKEIYDGRSTQQAIEKFRPIIKRGINQYINDSINETLKSAIKSHSDDEQPKSESAQEQPTESINNEIIEQINTTHEELEAYSIIKSLLHEHIDPNLITYKDTESYFAILYDNKTTKWLCRLMLDKKNKVLLIPPAAEPPYDKMTKYTFTDVNDIYKFKENIMKSAQRFMD